MKTQMIEIVRAATVLGILALLAQGQAWAQSGPSLKPTIARHFTGFSEEALVISADPYLVAAAQQFQQDTSEAVTKRDAAQAAVAKARQDKDAAARSQNVTTLNTVDSFGKALGTYSEAKRELIDAQKALDDAGAKSPAFQSLITAIANIKYNEAAVTISGTQVSEVCGANSVLTTNISKADVDGPFAMQYLLDHPVPHDNVAVSMTGCAWAVPGMQHNIEHVNISDARRGLSFNKVVTENVAEKTVAIVDLTINWGKVGAPVEEAMQLSAR